MNFTSILIHWYSLNKRELPWRNNIEPYRIWLSEIILQQTKIEQGLPYFERFVDNFPTVFDLANATEAEVLKLWQGLGYYSRARNLHKTAINVANNYDGIFPKTFDELKTLKGIGNYTAAAIASICFNENVPVVDGNVYRFLSRVFGIDIPIDTSAGNKYFFEKAGTLLDKKDPGSFNQAMMEYGALVCTPKKPQCQSCVFSNQCSALISNKVDLLPVKSKRIKKQSLFLNYAVITSDEGFFFQKRNEKGIWANMYEFPVLSTQEPASKKELELFFESLGVNIKSKIAQSEPIKHLLTHKKLEATFHSFKIKNYQPNTSLICISEPSDLTKYSMPKLIESFVEKSI